MSVRPMIWSTNKNKNQRHVRLVGKGNRGVAVVAVVVVGVVGVVVAVVVVFFFVVVVSWWVLALDDFFEVGLAIDTTSIYICLP